MDEKVSMDMQYMYRELKRLMHSDRRIERITDIARKYFSRFVIKHSLVGTYHGKEMINVFDDEIDTSKLDHKIARELCNMYTKHYFDLLGSGWVKVSYEDNAFGLEGYKYSALVLDTDKNGDFLGELIPKRNLKKSQQIWKMIEGEYEGIDWQKDFKTGWRWENKMFYHPRKWPEMGADIKVPWELGRLQHFPRFAILAVMMPDKQQKLYKEFRNQALDFIALNPVGWGVNYMCPMDVAIRIANMVLAWQLWKTVEQDNLSGDFCKIYFQYIYEQCYFVFNNLEWKFLSKENSGNHYIADLAGLIWGTSALQSNRKIKKWRNFAINELFQEIRKQYYNEGTHKEGSVGYHRLTTEIIVYTLAFLNAQGVKIEQDIYDILVGAANFLAVLTRPDGLFTQIGDNDSGRFFRLSFYGELETVENICKKYYNLYNYTFAESDFYFDETMNRTGELLNVIESLVDNCTLSTVIEPCAMECKLESSLIRNYVKCKHHGSIHNHVFARHENPNDLNNIYVQKFVFRKKINLAALRMYEFADIGILAIKSKELYFIFNLSQIPLDCKNGHTHNDKLSVEIFERERCLIEDGGTFLYTAIPEEQLKDKSVRNHLNVVINDMEQDVISRCGRWYIKNNDIKCYLVEASKTKVVAFVSYRDVIHYREINIYDQYIEIIDKSNGIITPVEEKRRITSGYGKWLSETWRESMWSKKSNE